MALRARLRQRLASEARRLAGALWRLADEADPARPGARSTGGGGPPEHWLAVVRARAPQLLVGRGIGARIEDPVVARGEAAAAPGACNEPRDGTDRAEDDGPLADAVIPPRRRADWPPSVGRDLDAPAFPTLDPRPRPAARWPALEPGAAASARWPTLPPSSSPSSAGPDWPASASSGRSAAPASAAVPAEPAPAAVDARWPPEPAPVLVTGRWPSSPHTPTVRAEPAFPTVSAVAGSPAFPEPHRPSAPAAVHVPVPMRSSASAQWHDGCAPGVWPALPDDTGQRSPAPALDDAARLHRLDTEQRGGG